MHFIVRVNSTLKVSLPQCRSFVFEPFWLEMWRNKTDIQ